MISDQPLDGDFRNKPIVSPNSAPLSAAERLVAQKIIAGVLPPIYGKMKMPDIAIAPPRPVDTSKLADNRPESIKDVDTNIVTGVVAATIKSNSMSPIAIDPISWDVLACPMAMLSGGLDSFRLPNPEFTIAQYAQGLAEAEFDEGCSSSNGPSKQHLINVRHGNSYILQATAHIRDQAGMDALMAAGLAQVRPLQWAGPWSEDEGYLIQIQILDHHIGSNYYSHDDVSVTIDVPSPLTVALGAVAVVDLTFIALDGGEWVVYPVRMR